MVQSARNLAYILLTISLSGWLLWVGADIIWPIVAAVICSYVLIAVTEQIDRIPLLRQAPRWLKNLVVAAGFAALIFFMSVIVGSTIDQLVSVAPNYQTNLMKLAADVSAVLGFESTPTWDTVRNYLTSRISLQSLVSATLGQLTSMGGQLFLIVFYASFLMAERGQFASKLMTIAGEPARAEQARNVISSINESIANYLAVKTLVNIILAFVSYVIMLLLGIDFAAFWAITIGLLNYIPYVGSIVGVLFPVLLSLAQFGSIGTTIAAALALTSAQMFVGYVVEPRMIGNSVNLSPFVVMVALTVWSALWGIPGAILAVPLTAIIAIVFAASPGTRGISILLSANGEAPVLERRMA